MEKQKVQDQGVSESCCAPTCCSTDDAATTAVAQAPDVRDVVREKYGEAVKAVMKGARPRAMPRAIRTVSPTSRRPPASLSRKVGPSTSSIATKIRKFRESLRSIFLSGEPVTTKNYLRFLVEKIVVSAKR